MSAKEDDLALQDLLSLVGDSSTVKKILQERNPENKKISCDEVFPNVFVGNAAAALDLSWLARQGVTHVVNTAQGRAPGLLVDTDQNYYKDVGVHFLGVSVLDLPTADMNRYFHDVAEFVHSAVNAGGRVLVHCMWGVSRSVTCVLAYLVIKKGLTVRQALSQVVQRRPVARPNDGFLLQLLGLERKLALERRFESSCCGGTGNGQCTISSPRNPNGLQGLPSDCSKAYPLEGRSQGCCPISSGPFSCSDDQTVNMNPYMYLASNMSNAVLFVILSLSR